MTAGAQSRRKKETDNKRAEEHKDKWQEGADRWGNRRRKRQLHAFLGKILAPLSNHTARCDKMWVQMVILQKNY